MPTPLHPVDYADRAKAGFKTLAKKLVTAEKENTGLEKLVNELTEELETVNAELDNALEAVKLAHKEIASLQKQLEKANKPPPKPRTKKVQEDAS